ncbi:sigma factor binding protein 1 [Quercus suber]|uniref:Sigma factor binding protein 1 n=1 Tax=Quercus suber TaxID=58331 RepID=A0AAW0JAQ8_QUESU
MKVIKVVYIASPKKVKTSASKFRDLAQELTSQDSDTARYVEVNGGDNQGSYLPFLTNNWGLILMMGCLISCLCQIPLVSFCLT